MTIKNITTTLCGSCEQVSRKQALKEAQMRKTDMDGFNEEKGLSGTFMRPATEEETKAVDRQWWELFKRYR